ncbi:MAG: response regulator [Candidatus Latescibacteria bacterium]|nr:response regulator [Candidatus Latescibacterota bacterium]
MSTSSKGRVLVVDDERLNRTLLRSLLQAAGYQVTEAEDGEQALQQVGAEAPDVILLDVMMPGLDGYTVCRRIKEDQATAHLPILIVTALNDREARLEGIGAGANDFLTKPIDRQEVLLRVQNAVYAKHLFDENLSYQRDLEDKVAAQTQELRLAYTRLEQQVRELEARDRLVYLQSSEADLAGTYAEILRVFAAVLPADRVLLYRPVGSELRAAAALGASAEGGLETPDQLAALPPLPQEGDTELVTRVFASGQPSCNDQDQAAAPLLYRDENLGVIYLEGGAVAGDEEQLNAFWRLSREAALVLHAVQIAEELSGTEDFKALIDLEGNE